MATDYSPRTVVNMLIEATSRKMTRWFDVTDREEGTQIPLDGIKYATSFEGLMFLVRIPTPEEEKLRTMALVAIVGEDEYFNKTEIGIPIKDLTWELIILKDMILENVGDPTNDERNPVTYLAHQICLAQQRLDNWESGETDGTEQK